MPRASEDVGDLRDGTGRAVGQPLAGHPRAVAHAVERRVVDRGRGLQVEDDDRHPRALHHRQDGRGERVGGDVEEDEVDVVLPEAVAGLAPLSEGCQSVPG